MSEASVEHLSDEVLEDRWQRHVRPDLFDDVAPSVRSTALLIGGQPGAGKTMGLQRARGLHPGTEFVPVVGDDLRVYHPRYVQLLAASDPALMPAATAQASAAWVRRSVRHAQEHRYSVIVEGTFREPATTLDTARGFAVAGHHVHVVALAVPEVVSRLSCLERYYRDVDPARHPDPATRVARWTPMAAHDAGYAGVPKTLAAAAADPSVARISVVDRSGQLLYNEARGAGSADAVAALTARREQPLTRDEMRAWLASYGDVQEIAARVGTTSEARAALGMLGESAEAMRAAMLRQASFPQHPRAGRTGHQQVDVEMVRPQRREPGRDGLTR